LEEKEVNILLTQIETKENKRIRNDQNIRRWRKIERRIRKKEEGDWRVEIERLRRKEKGKRSKGERG